ncbi:hypothetical protein I204_04884 [Kwoniella mangroviensis CBS 8886]|nr:uncharacterized protein I203_06297 [Kwoniella mangroviensis CBS 8507]OCF64566.1 hypothetical protein I203_06297 [Kwoniella mangroviensis CBS 8507]OCF74509.1 hypothetical protein I204_04884 [Kwoniella mangroviensis CBS 8886]
MYLADRDLTEFTKRLCYCQDEDPYCTCIEERIVCPVSKRAQSESAICLRGLDGNFICPPCQPSCCPRELSRALHDSNSDVWCPPCDYPQAATITEQVKDITQPTAK